jgi:uncharacterized protein (TIGR02996 family)
VACDQEIALLRRVATDDVARFVLADWLEENGRADEAAAVRKVAGFVRRVECSPAFDRRSSDPAQNYGVGCAKLRWILIGPKGAVQFVLYTNWHLPHVADEFEASTHRSTLLRPLPADVGYHSLQPRYEGQEVMDEACRYLDGRPCYYDGSSLTAQTAFTALVASGDDAIWGLLESYYADTFD